MVDRGVGGGVKPPVRGDKVGSDEGKHGNLPGGAPVRALPDGLEQQAGHASQHDRYTKPQRRAHEARLDQVAKHPPGGEPSDEQRHADHRADAGPAAALPCGVPVARTDARQHAQPEHHEHHPARRRVEQVKRGDVVKQPREDRRVPAEREHGHRHDHQRVEGHYRLRGRVGPAPRLPPDPERAHRQHKRQQADVYRILPVHAVAPVIAGGRAAEHAGQRKVQEVPRPERVAERSQAIHPARTV